MCVCAHTCTCVCAHRHPTLQMTDLVIELPESQGGDGSSAEQGREAQREEETYGRSHGLSTQELEGTSRARIQASSPPPPGLSGFTMSAQGESAATGKSRCRGNPGGESGTSQPPDTNGVWVWLLLTGSSKGEGRREATGATPLMFTSGLPSRPVGSTPGWGEAACREVPAEIKPALHPCPRLVPHGGPDASLPPASPRASS